jgi:hypothetical protein
MDKGSRLEGVSGWLGSHLYHRKLSQFIINERQELAGSLSVPAVGRFQETGYVSHTPDLIATGSWTATRMRPASQPALTTPYGDSARTDAKSGELAAGMVDIRGAASW